jgi:ADP-ribose pyrophosphatase YjhB (NUDIX family)
VLIAKIVKKTLQQYWRLSRALSLGVKAVVLDGDDRVLLVRTADGPAWSLPSANVLRGETAEDALRRMLAHDFSILLEAPPAFIGLQALPAERPNAHWTILAARQWRQNAPPSDRGTPSLEAGHFDAARPPQNVDPDDAAFIAAALARGAGHLAGR